MTDRRNDNSTRPEPLPADYEDGLRRVDEALAEQAAHQRAAHGEPVGLSQRVYEASVTLLAGAEERPATSLRPERSWRLPLRVLAAAAAVALMLTVGAVVWSLSGQRQPRLGPLAGKGALPELIGAGAMPLVETLESAYDRRIGRTELVLKHLASADPWNGPSIWEEVESELITTVEGW